MRKLHFTANALTNTLMRDDIITCDSAEVDVHGEKHEQGS